MPPPVTAHVATTHAALASARAALARRNGAILADQIAVTSIAAPTGEESKRAAWIADRFHALGLSDVHVDGAGSVVGTRGGEHNEPPVVMCAHLDTVFPREAIATARRDATRVAAPGIGDNGRGLAVMLALAQTIDGAAVRTRRPVVFVATTGEEGHGDLRGAKHHFATGSAAFAAIALDGTGDERIVHRAVGSRRFRVTFRGPGGHSWSDFGVANPLHASAQAIARLASLPLPADPRTTLTVSRANGGLSVNSIPETAWFEVDTRSIAAAPLNTLDADLRAIVDAAVRDANAARAPRTAPLTADVEVIGNRPGGELAPDHSLVVTAAEATRLVGRTPELATASTDANIPLSLGIPAISIGGGGDGGEVHTLSEWYDDTDGLRGVERALTILVATANAE